MARGGPRPIERLHAGGVTGEQHPPLRRKPGGEGEDAIEPGQAFLAMQSEQVGEDFGVAAAAEGCAFPLEPTAQLAVVIDLAVEGDDDPSVRGTHRLTAGLRKVEDRQPYVG